MESTVDTDDVLTDKEHAIFNLISIYEYLDSVDDKWLEVLFEQYGAETTLDRIDNYRAILNRLKE